MRRIIYGLLCLCSVHTETMVNEGLEEWAWAPKFESHNMCAHHFSTIYNTKNKPVYVRDTHRKALWKSKCLFTRACGWWEVMAIL